jgi:Ca2+-binding EF-hand superfamily protein
MLAQQGGQGTSSDTKKYDVTPLFDEVDTNHDGKITKAEWKAAGFPDQPFDMWDPDKKGYLTKEGFGSFSHPAAMDTNNDGKLTKEKLLAYIKMRHASGATEGNSRGGGPKEGAAAGAPEQK